MQTTKYHHNLIQKVHSAPSLCTRVVKDNIITHGKTKGPFRFCSTSISFGTKPDISDLLQRRTIQSAKISQTEKRFDRANNDHVRGKTKGTGKNVNGGNRLEIYKGLLAK